MTREGIMEKIEATREEIKTAGPIHRKDLYRHLKRLTKELREYDLQAASISGMFDEARHYGRI